MPQPRARILCLLGLLMLSAPFAAANAEDELSAYVGGAIGQSQIGVDSINFSGHDIGWKAIVGVRALSALGAEAEYVDMGHPRGNTPSGHVNSQGSGPAVFGLAYLPLLLPYLDIYVKAGLANIQQRTTITLSSGGNACAAGVGCDGFNRSESEFAWGGGAQLKAGSFSVRFEVEQFRASGGQLNLGTVGFLWNFP